jgi:hypothetical protein
MATIRLAKGRRVPLAAFGFRELWHFVHGWHPPAIEVERQASRWQTWDQFFEDYDSIEDELIERLASGDVPARLRAGQRLPFGSTIRGDMQPGQCYDGHRHAALLHAHIYRRDDGHRHTDQSEAAVLDLGPAVEVREEIKR